MELKIDLIKPRTTFNVDAVASSFALALNQATVRAMTVKPDIRVLNLEELTKDDIKAYFKSLHTQEWGRRSIVDEELMETAADWFQNEINRLYAFIASNQRPEL